MVECRNGHHRYPPSQFSFSIPTSRVKFLLLVCYAHVHLLSETTPTSVYKLSHTHIVVKRASLCKSATIAKVRETFWRLICPCLLRDWRFVVGDRWSGQPWLGPGSVKVVCAFRQFFVIARTSENVPLSQKSGTS